MKGPRRDPGPLRFVWHTIAVGERSVKWVLASLLLSQPLIFARVIPESFDLVKYLIAVPLGGFLLGTLWSSPKLFFKVDAVTLCLAAFFGSLALSTLLSESPWLSFYGQTFRYTGLLTFAICGAVFCWCRYGVLKDSVVRNIGIFIAFASSTYVILQFHGLDPFEWNTPSFSGSVTGLMGNPNTSTAAIAVFCIFPFGMLARAQHYVVQILGGVIFLSCAYAIGLAGSFVGVLHVAGVLVFTARNLPRERRHANSVDWFSATLATAFGLLLSVSPSTFAFCLSLAVLVASVSLRLHRHVAITRKVYQFALLLLSPSLLVFKSQFATGLQSGFLERGDFYRAAISIFKSHPIIGSGVETYGVLFPRFRPDGHAIRLEDSISSSAHNLLLGILSTAGILGAASLVALFSFVILRYMRTSREKLIADKELIFSGTVTFALVSMFMVEHLALWITFFAFLGMLAQTQAKQVPRRRARGSELRGASLVVGVALAIFLSVSVSRPLYLSARDQLLVDQELIPSGNGVKALEVTERSYLRVKWNGYSQLRLGEIQLRAGLGVSATENLLNGLRKVGFSPPASRLASQLLYQAQEFVGTLDVIEATTQALVLPPKTSILFEKLCLDINTIGQNSGDEELVTRSSHVLELVGSRSL